MTQERPYQFVSYAQNLEDVVLWRALGHVSGGFYIDVGAASPRIDSVTLAFYERGWRGINVEPHPVSYVALTTDRPRDMNLNVALADGEAEARMSLASNPALSTLDPVEARRLEGRGLQLTPHRVTVSTLRSVWRDHVPPGQEVHFLKVDVEGFERRVLLGNDWASNRPWIVVVEATKPERQVSSHADWEPILLESTYQLAYWDGLNRFYVAEEHGELLASFDHPPDVFDQYVRASEVEANQRAQHAADEAASLRANLDDLYTSRSWRVTRPLRGLGAAARAVLARLRRANQARRRESS